MIITKITGGLGNQLFQYAIGRAVADYHQAELKPLLLTSVTYGGITESIEKYLKGKDSF